MKEQRDDAADRAYLRPAYVHIDRDVYTERRNVHNSRAALLRRLRKDRLDIHARVLAGELPPERFGAAIRPLLQDPEFIDGLGEHFGADPCLGGG